MSACEGGSASGSHANAFTLTINDDHHDNHVVQQELTVPGKRSRASQNKALPSKTQTPPIGNVDQKAQLRAGQDALPVQFAAGGAPQLTKTLDKAGQVLDLKKTLKDLGVRNVVQPAAVKTVEKRLGPFLHLPARRLPTLLNRVLFEDGGANAAAELEAARPSGTAD
ncbi:hypothetical protein [Streptomyces canus]|uniref:hypothetical protein n=1 Tax=Streptomyces canus TaxID=58343 RepID=UPI002787C939|nr:hypothetical protein [Streptomyces canus]MDQ0766703.1 putative phage infection (PIP) family protein YhgE [Streptomyces canus]